MSWIVTTLLLCCLVLPLRSAAEEKTEADQLSRDRMRSLLKEANDFFAKANEQVSSDIDRARILYEKALMRYKKIVKAGGVRNGRLFYNIGNVYFRMDDIGHAILYYRMAQQYIPNDENLRRNLEYARSRREDAFETTQTKKVLETLFFWHYDLPASVRATVFYVLFALGWVLGTVRLVRRPWISRWWIVGCALLAAIFFASLAWEHWEYRNTKPGVIIADEVTARKGDGESYSSSFETPLHDGTEFVVQEKRGDWVHIRLPDGRTCWLPAKSVKFVPK